ncbi:hypothetical protein LASUN_08750 [Lentilactobacillus sunkii]|jgi:hypothetical protein|uniref:DUF4811 domain-containing protein n=1 Tax=Lentilactobacillus sunkii TaxID=481719 RepID=A0A1E7XDT5_9LACO|nr:DUF4811 domain-containing protein [Lentilactobacillus sunkii]OFA11266.1 hypothetical protein LASUN_08750 [Lentilactobacillus sunkii]
MIVLTLVIGVVLSFVFFIYISSKPASYTLTALSLLLAIVSLVFIIKNDHDHYGMKQVTKTTTEQIYPIGNKQMQMILYQPIGTANKHQVYVYQKSQDSKKKSHTQTTDTTNKVVKVSGTTHMVTNTTRWEFTSDATKLWFGISGENHKFIKRQNILYVNKSVQVLSVQQAKALKKMMASKSYQAKLKTQAKAFITKQVMTAMKKNPTMSAADRAKVMKQAQADFQAQAVKNALTQIKK